MVPSSGLSQTVFGSAPIRRLLTCIVHSPVWQLTTQHTLFTCLSLSCGIQVFIPFRVMDVNDMLFVPSESCEDRHLRFTRARHIKRTKLLFTQLTWLSVYLCVASHRPRIKHTQAFKLLLINVRCMRKLRLNDHYGQPYLCSWRDPNLLQEHQR